MLKLNLLTPEEKSKIRVQIAYDVLNSLKEKTLRPKHMIYLKFIDNNSLDYHSFINQKLDVVLKDVSCEVCALGALFIKAVEKFDDILVSEGLIGIDIDATPGGIFGLNKDYLHQWFEPEQLMDIEAAFEGWSAYRQVEEFNLFDEFPDACEDNDESNQESWDPDLELIDFSELPLFKELAAERMSMIMKNIIDNNGDFNPHKFVTELQNEGYPCNVIY